MSKEHKTFSVIEQLDTDFMRVVDVVANVLPLFKRSGRIEKRCAGIKTSIDTLEQDIKNLKAAQKTILDEQIVQNFEGIINNKNEEIASKESVYEKLFSEKNKINSEIRAYEVYARTAIIFFETTGVINKVNFVELTKEQILACIFMGINVSNYVEIARMEVARQEIFILSKMPSDEFKKKLKEIL